MPVSWKPGFKIRGEHYTDAKPYSLNGQAFATREEAEKSAAARFMVWTMPYDKGVVESTDPVNYKWVDGRGDVLIEMATVPDVK